MTDYARWQKVANEPSPWRGRIELMAKLIPDARSVLDVGAGSQELREVLPPGVEYLSLGCTQGSPDRPLDFQVDLNGNFSGFTARVDAVFLSGVLEYLQNPHYVLQCIARDIGPRWIVLSYDHRGDDEGRAASGWTTSTSVPDLPGYDRVFTGEWEGQAIYLYTRPARLIWTTCGYKNGNSGDECGLDLARYYTGGAVGRAEDHRQADLISVGSIAQEIPADYRGYVWGTGIMFEHRGARTPKAKVCAVRGKLTARRWDELKDVPLGDPGLLVADVYGVRRQEVPTFQVGLVPHYIDAESMDVRAWAQNFRDEVTVIDICARPRAVLEEMAACRHILSSSLHGLVFADALGIPNEWIVLSDKLAGGSFKFRDHLSVFGINDPVARGFGPNVRPKDVVDGGLARGYERPGLERIKADLVNAFPKALKG